MICLLAGKAEKGRLGCLRVAREAGNHDTIPLKMLLPGLKWGCLLISRNGKPL
jgi:hypothetical protein